MASRLRDLLIADWEFRQVILIQRKAFLFTYWRVNAPQYEIWPIDFQNFSLFHLSVCLSVWILACEESDLKIKSQFVRPHLCETSHYLNQVVYRHLLKMWLQQTNNFTSIRVFRLEYFSCFSTRLFVSISNYLAQLLQCKQAFILLYYSSWWSTLSTSFSAWSSPSWSAISCLHNDHSNTF